MTGETGRGCEEGNVTERNSVLQGWVEWLPLREQGTLLTAVRGCDLAPKDPNNLLSPERHLTAWIRWCFLNPADVREVDHSPGCWFRSTPPPNFRPSSVSHYPFHWIGHVMHALEVVGYRHPDASVAARASDLYRSIARGMHLTPETFEEYESRLGEDRVAAGTMVS